MPTEAPLMERLLSASPDAILLVDEQGRIAGAHGGTLEVLGYSADELVGRSVEDLLPAGMRGGHVEQRRHFTAEKRGRPMGSGRLVSGLHKDGRHVPLDIKLSPFEEGGQRYVVAIARDISHLVQTQRTLAARTEQLEAIDREKNRILGFAAHDLRNPLAALRGFIDVVDHGLIGDLDLRAQRLLRCMSRSIDYMTRLVDGLVDFSAIESGHLSIDLQPIDLGLLVEESIAIQRLAAGRKAVTLVVDCPADLGLVNVDPAKFEQVVHNLVGNAVRYSPEGGDVRVAVSRIGDHVVLSVDDDGPGIADDQRHTVFMPFVRGEQAPREGSHSDKGVGLGLAIVKRIIEGHGGTIRVDSAPGTGTRFTVAVPS